MQSKQALNDLIKKLKNKIWPFVPPIAKYLYKKLKYNLIPAISLRVTYLKRFARVQKLSTLILKPLDRVNHYAVEINLGYKCNLRCLNCEASCRQAPSEESVTLEQIKKFIDESILQKRKWKIITIVGGEPTIHPQFFEILQQLLSYKKLFSSDTEIRIFSNGAGEKVNMALAKIPREIVIFNTKKTSNINLFTPFNIAPKDTFLYKYADFSNGCCQLKLCGMGFNLYGFYPCVAGANIDRVLGFNIGRKHLPSLDDSMADQIQVLCKHCGHFMYFFSCNLEMITTSKEMMSPSWKKAYEDYKIAKPSLSQY
jgi:hypothetical protein